MEPSPLLPPFPVENNSESFADTEILMSGGTVPTPSSTDEIFLECNDINYSTDVNGNILPSTPLFNAHEVFMFLKEKIQSPPEKWIRRVKDGLLVYFIEDKESNSSLSFLPDFISLLDCIDLVAMMIFNTLEKYIPIGQTLEDLTAPLPQNIPSNTDLEFYSWTMDLLNTLHKLVPKSHCLLPSSPSVRVIIRYLTAKIMCESLFWIEQTSIKGENVEERIHLFAISSFVNASQIINRVADQDLKMNSQFKAQQQQPVEPGTLLPCYNFLWMHALSQNGYSSRYISWVTQCVILAQRRDSEHGVGEDSMEICDSISNGLWDCVHQSATLFYHACFIDNFVRQLVIDPQCEQILLSIESILKLQNSESKPHINKAKYELLRIFTVLGENEEPYFLDYASKMRSSFSVAELVSREAHNISKYVKTVASVDENAVNPSPALIARESLRVAELLSYDSNFVKFVTEHLSLFILEYLSVSTEEFKNYFNIETPFPRYITALVFRMIANLHCFNPEVSPPDQKHFLIKKIAYYFTTIWKPGEDGEPICTSKVNIPNIAINLWVLFRQVTEGFSFTLQELEFWRSFIGELQKYLNLLFPPPASEKPNTPATQQPNFIRRSSVTPKEGDKEYKSESEPDDEMEDDADEFVLNPSVKPATIRSSLPAVQGSMASDINLDGPPTDILRGVSVCFGAVNDLPTLKALIKHHGGSVLGYVTKSVTHVICGHDIDSVDKSSSKIHSAAQKQVPVVSEKLIYDSIAEGQLLGERPYLISTHSYIRRLMTPVR